MPDLREQYYASLSQAESARSKAEQDSQRHYAEVQQRNAYHQALADRAMRQSYSGPGFTDRVMSAAGGIGSAAITGGQALLGGMAMAGAHVYNGVAAGAGYAYANAQQHGSSAAGAFGMAGGSVVGPTARGINGPYLQAGQSFSGLLYEAGLGAGLNTATFGMLFRDYNQVVGMPSELVKQRSQEELSLRMRSVGNSAVLSLTKLVPYSVLNTRFSGMTSDTRREVSRRMSFISGPASDLVGGLGISSTGKINTDITNALFESGREYDKARGYSLSNEEERGFQNAALNTMGITQLQKLAETSSRSRKAEIKQARDYVHRISENLRISTDELGELTKEFGLVLGPENLKKLSDAASAIGQSGRGGGLSGVQLTRLSALEERRGWALGMSESQGINYGTSLLAERGAILAQRKGNILSRVSLAAFGGDNEDDQATNWAAAMRQAGLNYGTNPTIAGMFANARGNSVMSNLAAGVAPGGLLGFLGAQASLSLSDPIAALRAKYDPAAKERLANIGQLAAFQESKLYTPFDIMSSSPEDSRTLQIARFERATGLSSVQAMHAWDRNKGIEDAFKAINPDTASENAAAYSLMSRVDSSTRSGVGESADAVQALLKDVGGYEKFGAMSSSQQRQAVNKAVGANFAAAINAREKTFNIDNPKIDPDLSDESYRLRWGSGRAGAFGGLGTAINDDEEDIERVIGELIKSGLHGDIINAALAGTEFFAVNGDLRSNSDPDRSDAKSWWRRARPASNRIQSLVDDLRSGKGVSPALVAQAERERARRAMDVDKYMETAEGKAQFGNTVNGRVDWATMTSDPTFLDILNTTAKLNETNPAFIEMRNTLASQASDDAKKSAGVAFLSTDVEASKAARDMMASRVRGISLAGAPLGSTNDKPMFVTIVPPTPK